MRDMTAIFGSTIMSGFLAASVAAFRSEASGDATTPVVLAAGAGLGLGLLLIGLRTDRQE